MSSTSTTTTTTSTTRPSQTRKINRLDELKKLATASEGKQKFQVKIPNIKIKNQQIKLYTRNFRNNFVGSQLAKNNPSEYLHQKKKLNVKYKMNENAQKRQRALLLTTTTQNRGRTRGPGARGTGTSSTANNITRRIREAREKRAKDHMNALIRGNYRE